MNKSNNLIWVIKFLLIIIAVSSTSVKAHKSATHDPETHMDPVKCIPESERTPGQLKWDITVNKQFHRLSKRQVDCAIAEIQKLKQGQSELEKLLKAIEAAKSKLETELANAAICADVNFNHKSSKKAILFTEPNSKSRKVADIKSGTNLLYISDSASQKKWSFVLLKNEDKCSPGYIQKEFISKKNEVVQQAPKEVKADLISITNPTWAKKEKLIIVSASGFITIKGFVDTNKIDQIIVNEKERQINNDDTFSFNIRVKDAGTEVRIVGNKQGDTKKTMTFLIKAE